MHYAVPRSLHQGGRLDRLFTDICAVVGWPRYLELVPRALQPSAMKRLVGRVPEGIPPGLITTFPSLGLEYAIRQQFAKTPTQRTRAYLWANKVFCERILEHGLEPGSGGIYA